MSFSNLFSRLDFFLFACFEIEYSVDQFLLVLERLNQVKCWVRKRTMHEASNTRSFQ